MSKRYKNRYLPVEVIIAATQGEAAAIQTVLKTYESYIRNIAIESSYPFSGPWIYLSIHNTMIEVNACNTVPIKHKSGPNNGGRNYFAVLVLAASDLSDLFNGFLK